jgi:hypothetical protein
MSTADGLAIRPDEWISVLTREYLDGFVPAGGALVRVAVCPSPEEAAGLGERVRVAGVERGFVVAHVDAAVCRAHLVDRLVAEVARQVPWDELAAGLLRAALRRRGYDLPEDGRLDTGALAERRDLDERLVLQEVRELLTREIMQDYALCREFRLAAVQLCRALLMPDPQQQERAERVKDWLRQELPRIGLLRDTFIFQAVNRHNARAIFNSATAFIRKAGRPGLLVTLDISRYAVAAPPDEGPRYSRSAAMDMYESVRQFIDETDDVTGCLLVVLTVREFLDDDRRGLRAYPALQMRLGDDVRGGNRPNPLAPMLRVRG